MTKQSIKLIIMFILGLPALPMACLCWILDHTVLPEGRLVATKEGFIACMLACTVFAELIYVVYKLTS